MKDEIINWLVSSEMDFDEGVAILKKNTPFSKKKRYSALLRKRDKNRLEYELKILLGMTPSEIFTQKGSNSFHFF